MADKTLKDKAIQIKGKDYVKVESRITYFNENYKEGNIKTRLISTQESDMVIVKAKVTPDHKYPDHFFTGYSQAKWSDTTSFVNKSSALENAETSAVGRALAMMGIGVIDEVRSADEMNKSSYSEPSNMYQINEIKALIEKLGVGERVEEFLTKAKVKKIEDLSKARAQYLLDQLRIKRDNGEV